MSKMKDARMKALKRLKKKSKDEMYSDPMKELTEGMQKVTVASDSKEGLKKGLDKAKEIMEKRFADGGYKRGYEEPMQRKKPKYLSHRKEEKELMHDQYACGGVEKDKYKDGGYKKEALKKLRKRK